MVKNEDKNNTYEDRLIDNRLISKTVYLNTRLIVNDNNLYFCFFIKTVLCKMIYMG